MCIRSSFKVLLDFISYPLPLQVENENLAENSKTKYESLWQSRASPERERLAACTSCNITWCVHTWNMLTAPNKIRFGRQVPKMLIAACSKFFSVYFRPWERGGGGRLGGGELTGNLRWVKQLLNVSTYYFGHSMWRKFCLYKYCAQEENWHRVCSANNTKEAIINFGLFIAHWPPKQPCRDKKYSQQIFSYVTIRNIDNVLE